jgi:putative ABC transport system substrate-binding protein
VGSVKVLRRRAFFRGLAMLSAAGTGLVAVNGCRLIPLVPQSSKVARVGYLGDPPDAPWSSALWEALAEFGWVEGQTMAVVRRDEGAGDRSALVHDLLAVLVDVLVTVGTPATLAAQTATDTTPIVFTSVADPVGVGVVASLARPGGNVTGVSVGASGTPHIDAKRFELLGEVVPRLTRLAFIVNSDNPAASAVTRVAIQESAEALGLQLLQLDVSTPGAADELAGAFAAAARWPADAVTVPGGFVTQRTHIADLAARSHIPVIYAYREFVEAGGLMSYGASLRSTHQHAATYVDKILRGARPADLPVEQLTTLEFVVNVKALQELGLTLPPDVAAQVTEWVT